MVRRLAFAAVFIGGIAWWLASPSTEELTRQLRTAVAANDGATVNQLADRILAKDPTSAPALLAKGRETHRLGRFREAVELLDRVPPASPEADEARFLAAETTFVSLKRLTDAETRFRGILKDSPNRIPALEQMAILCGLTGRIEEANSYRLRLIQLGKTTILDLIVLGLRETVLAEGATIEEFEAVAPDDPLVLVAKAYVALHRHEPAEAEALIRPRLADRSAPPSPTLELLWGEWLAENRRTDEIPGWFDRLSEEARKSSTAWRVRGRAARQAEDLPTAARCEWEAMRRNPVDQPACYELGQILATLRAPESETFLQRATDLQELLLAIREVNNTREFGRGEEIARRCAAVGLEWEAWTWQQIADNFRQRPGAPPPAIPPRPTHTERTDPKFDLTRRFDLTRYPLPIPQASEATSNSVARTSESSSIRFRDDTQGAGLRMTYENGHDPALGGRRAFEFSGGGVSVLDYDRDGWPDLHFPQGSRWPVPAGQRDHLDQLYRNRGSGTFTEVAAPAALVEERYSQGSTVGDLDQDGFPDLFVANVGQNRLFRNCGDGTFEDITETAGLKEAAWSTSAALADLDGDRLPDLYVVNYLGGADVTERLCRGPDGTVRECDPHDFPAAPDEVYRNLGDGRFDRREGELGLRSDSGKGLGVVVGRFGTDDACSVFVANDLDGNLLFRRPHGGEKFEEDSLLTGVKFDAEGRALACMGMAAGDATGDGLLDFVITNYYDESNMFFVQQPGAGGLFLDQAAEADLRLPSMKMLGFGTQFLDADLDGWLDLVVVNGHVARQRRSGTPYEMQPQLFRNLRGRGFAEESARGGEWFHAPILGRGLARLDWNRDGLEDFAVGRQEGPANLLTNESTPEGMSLALTLVGTASDRDAIGTTVRLAGAGAVQARFVTAGDGYMGTNQRVLTFAIPRSAGPMKGLALEITWPSGVTESYAVASGTRAAVAVEQTGRLLSLEF